MCEAVKPLALSSVKSKEKEQESINELRSESPPCLNAEPQARVIQAKDILLSTDSDPSVLEHVHPPILIKEECTLEIPEVDLPDVYLSDVANCVEKFNTNYSVNRCPLKPEDESESRRREEIKTKFNNSDLPGGSLISVKKPSTCGEINHNSDGVGYESVKKIKVIPAAEDSCLPVATVNSENDTLDKSHLSLTSRNSRFKDVKDPFIDVLDIRGVIGFETTTVQLTTQFCKQLDEFSASFGFGLKSDVLAKSANKIAKPLSSKAPIIDSKPIKVKHHHHHRHHHNNQLEKGSSNLNTTLNDPNSVQSTPHIKIKISSASTGTGNVEILNSGVDPESSLKESKQVLMTQPTKKLKIQSEEPEATDNQKSRYGRIIKPKKLQDFVTDLSADTLVLESNKNHTSQSSASPLNHRKLSLPRKSAEKSEMLSSSSGTSKREMSSDMSNAVTIKKSTDTTTRKQELFRTKKRPFEEEDHNISSQSNCKLNLSKVISTTSLDCQTKKPRLASGALQLKTVKPENNITTSARPKELHIHSDEQLKKKPNTLVTPSRNSKNRTEKDIVSERAAVEISHTDVRVKSTTNPMIMRAENPNNLAKRHKTSELVLKHAEKPFPNTKNKIPEFPCTPPGAEWAESSRSSSSSSAVRNVNNIKYIQPVVCFEQSLIKGHIYIVTQECGEVQLMMFDGHMFQPIFKEHMVAAFN